MEARLFQFKQRTMRHVPVLRQKGINFDKNKGTRAKIQVPRRWNVKSSPEEQNSGEILERTRSETRRPITRYTYYDYGFGDLADAVVRDLDA